MKELKDGLRYCQIWKEELRQIAKGLRKCTFATASLMRCHGFCERGRTTIFDMRITDTDARSHRKKEFAKVLEQHKKEKKDKYLQNCLEMRKDFTPMVYSVDGIAAREAQNAEKRLATHLASKWNREYSQMVYYVRVRMAIAVVRANSLIIRGSPVPPHP